MWLPSLPTRPGQLGERLERRPGARALVGLDDRVALAALDRDGHDLLGHQALVDRLQRELVRAQRPAVEVGAGELQLVADLGRLVEHLAAGERVGQPVVDHRVEGLRVTHAVAEARAGKQVRSARHRLHPAADADLDVTRADRLVEDHRGAQARGADLVDGLRGDLLRDPALDLCLTRGDLTLTGLQHLAHHDVLDLLRGDSGPLERPRDRRAAQVGGVQRGQATAHLADRGAGGAEDDGLGHVWFSGTMLEVQAGAANGSARRPHGAVADERRTGTPLRPAATIRGRTARTPRRVVANHSIGSRLMHVTATTDAPPLTGADTIAIGVFDDEGVAHDVDGGALDALLRRRRGAAQVQARRRHPRGRLAVDRRRAWVRGRSSTPSARGSWRPRSSPARWRSAPERSAGSFPITSATTSPGRSSRARCSPGTASTRSRARRTRTSPRGLDGLIVSAHHDVGPVVERAALIAGAQNAARDLQNRPANDLTPTALAGAARDLAARSTASRSRSSAAPRSRRRGWARSARCSAARTRSPP